jgi:hypothetical protein
VSRSRDGPGRGTQNHTPARRIKQPPGPGDDFVTNALWVLFEALWGMVVCVAVPLGRLVRFVCWDAWTRQPDDRPKP